MRKTARHVAALAALTSVALAMSACSGGASEPSQAGAGGTLVIDKSFDLVTADPARMFETTGNIVLRAVYDTLLTFENGDTSTPVPSIAESYVANDDATEYTFTLRSDVTFSDGTALTADDVIFSLNRVKNVQGNGSFLMEGLSVSAPDETTVVIDSETSNTAIPAIVTSPTLGIVNSAVVEENGGTDADDAAESDSAESFLNSESQGSGPYMLDSFDTSTETVLVPNPNYWGDDTALYDRVVVRNATAETQLMDIQSGSAQLALDLGSDQTAALEGNSDVIVTTSASPAVFFLFANANPDVSEITSSPDFREAVRYGVDFDAILELAGDGASRSYGIIPTQFLGSLGSEDGYERDVDRAKEAVARLGSDTTISLEYANDISLNGLSFGTIAERIQAQLAEVGLNIELAPGPVATTLESYRGGTEEMGLWYWSPDYPDPADYLVFGPGGIVGERAGWSAGSDAELEAVMAEAATETDATARESLFEEFQRGLNEAAVILPLFQPGATVVSQSSVGEVSYDPAFGLMINEIGR